MSYQFEREIKSWNEKYPNHKTRIGENSGECVLIIEVGVDFHEKHGFVKSDRKNELQGFLHYLGFAPEIFPSQTPNDTKFSRWTDFLPRGADTPLAIRLEEK